MCERVRMQRALSLCLLVAAMAAGCASPGMPRFAAAPPAPNPLYLPQANEEALWERTVDVLHDYHLKIVRENRLARTIETEYMVGSGILEPWHHDSVGLGNRLESTLQSVRRKILVSILPDERGGYRVAVEAHKEVEDLPGVAANSPGGATFQENAPLERNLNNVVGQSAPSGWIPVGRDLALEQSLVASLQVAYTR